MITVNDVIAHLRLHTTSFGTRIGGGAEIAEALDEAKKAVPAAYVIPVQVDAQPNTSGHEIRQTITVTFTVVVVVSNAADERGQVGYAQIEAIRSELWAALYNWMPDLTAEPVQYVGDQLVEMDRGRIFWGFSFEYVTQLGPEDGFKPLLNDLEQINIRADVIDPAADPNLVYPGPDGRIEVEASAVLPIGIRRTTAQGAGRLTEDGSVRVTE